MKLHLVDDSNPSIYIFLFSDLLFMESISGSGRGYVLHQALASSV